MLAYEPEGLAWAFRRLPQEMGGGGAEEGVGGPLRELGPRAGWPDLRQRASRAAQSEPGNPQAHHRGREAARPARDRT